MSTDKTVVLVTGANSGIGYWTVIALAQLSERFHVLLSSRSIEKGQKALDEIRATQGPSLKGDISVIQLDVTDTASIAAAKDLIEKRFGKLDALVSNAGLVVTDAPDTLTAIRGTFETNVFGALALTEALEPLLQRASPGPAHIVYVSSEQGSINLRLNPSYRWYHTRGDVYRMSKAAMNMMAACHRLNYADWGCRVCAFNPGFTATNFAGEVGRQLRAAAGGARDPREPADAIVDILTGKRDADLEKSGIVDVDGGVLPW